VRYAWIDAQGKGYGLDGMCRVLNISEIGCRAWKRGGKPVRKRLTDALTMAWFRRKPTAGLMHHSDRGSQYASHAFQARLAEYGMICPTSRKGNCWATGRQCNIWKTGLPLNRRKNW
jgi:putative transposase